MQHIRIPSEWKIILPFAMFKLLIHLLTANVYGFHKEEFFFMYLGNYPDVGYFSSQPMTGLLSMVTQELLGNSLLIMRFIPAVFGALTVVVIGRIIKLLNGNTTALLFALTAYVMSPVFLRSNVLFTTDFIDQFIWVLASLLMLRLLKTKNTQNWILLGLVMGAGLLTKWSILIFASSFLMGLLISPQRRLLFSKDLLIGIGTGLLLFSPSLLWHYDHDFHYFKNYSSLRILSEQNSGFIGYFATQILMNLPGVIIWGFGLVYAVTNKQDTYTKPIGFTFIAVLIGGLIFLSHPFYISGVYPILLAIGGKAMEEWLEPRSELLKARFLIFIVFIGIPVLPLAIPILDSGTLNRYCKYVRDAGITFPFKWEDGETHEIPQFYGKMEGWDELGDYLTIHWYSLTENEKLMTAIFVEDHKIACAIDYYARKNGLPLPICFSDNFILHNPSKLKIENIIYVGNHPENWLPYFNEYRVHPPVFSEEKFFHNYSIQTLGTADDEFGKYYREYSEKLRSEVHFRY